VRLPVALAAHQSLRWRTASSALIALGLVLGCEGDAPTGPRREARPPVTAATPDVDPLPPLPPPTGSERPYGITRTFTTHERDGSILFQKLGDVPRPLVGLMTIKQRATQDGPDRGHLVAGPQGVYVAGFYDNRCVLKAIIGYRYSDGGGWTDDWRPGGANCPSAAEEESNPHLTWLRFPAAIWGGRSSGSAELCGSGCHTYGGYTTFTFTPTTTVLSVTASPTTVRAGAQVTFTVSRADGGLIPAVDRWTWRARGAPATDEEVVCTHGATVCTTEVFEDGWMFAHVVIDGYIHTGYAGVRVVPPEIDLAVSSTEPTRGHQVTYTASPNPATSTLVVSSWLFVPDDQAAETSSPCGSDNPCVVTADLPGTMTVYGTLDGRWSDADDVHVTPKADFTLHAEPTSVSAGGTVTFTPKLDGEPVTAARWRWEPDDEGEGATEACEGGTEECVTPVHEAGTMWAYLAEEAGADSASAAVIVTVTDPCPVGSPTASSGVAYSLAAADDCGGGEEPPADPVTYKLRVIAHRAPTTLAKGMTGEPMPFGADTVLEVSLKKDTTVTYSYQADGGYHELTVVLDDTLAASSGSITMDRDRTLEVSASEILEDDAEVVRYRDAYRSLLTTAVTDPRSVPKLYAEYLGAYINQRRRLDGAAVAALDAELEMAEYLAIDLRADAAALRAYDDALGGRSFEFVDMGGTVKVRPVFADELVLASQTPGSPSQSLASATPRAGGGEPSRFKGTKVIYVNGIRTDMDGVLGSRDALADLVLGMNLPNTQVLYFWNRNLKWQLDAYETEYGCSARYWRDLEKRGSLAALDRYHKCKDELGVSKFFKSILENDLVESFGAWARLTFRRHLGIPVPQDVSALAGHLVSNKMSGYHTILVAHSQGNLIVAEALPMVAEFESYPLQTTRCTAVLALAAPLARSQYNNVGLEDKYLEGWIAHGDIIWMLGLNGFDEYSTLQSVKGTVAVTQASLLMKPFVEMGWGVKIHSMNASYVPKDQVIDSDHTRHRLQRLYNTCNAR
jgi:hypothetical protein